MERELKYALTQRGYETLHALASGDDKHQINTYFETRERSLRRAGAGLRVRLENGRHATMTLKAAVASTDKNAHAGWHERREWECKITLPVLRALTGRRRKLSQLDTPVLRALRRHLPLISVEALGPIGSLETWRCPLKVGRFHGELDRWKVGKRVLYELEVETTRRGPAEKAVRAFFALHGIAVRPRASTKLATFFRLSNRN